MRTSRGIRIPRSPSPPNHTGTCNRYAIRFRPVRGRRSAVRNPDREDRRLLQASIRSLRADLPPGDRRCRLASRIGRSWTRRTLPLRQSRSLGFVPAGKGLRPLELHIQPPRSAMPTPASDNLSCQRSLDGARAFLVVHLAGNFLSSASAKKWDSPGRFQSEASWLAVTMSSDRLRGGRTLHIVGFSA